MSGQLRPSKNDAFLTSSTPLKPRRFLGFCYDMRLSLHLFATIPGGIHEHLEVSIRGMELVSRVLYYFAPACDFSAFVAYL